MRGLATTLAVVVSVGVCAVAGRAQAVMIQPGKAIGSVELGMPLDRARAIMDTFGAVEEIDTANTHGFCNPDRGVGICAFDRWERLGLNTPGAVAYIVTDDARFTTDAGGRKVGEPLLEFLKTFGLYTGGQGTEVRWDGRGLSVDVGPAEAGIVVRLVSVFVPRAVSALAPAGR
jgi:hypothetical protein